MSKNATKSFIHGTVDKLMSYINKLTIRGEFKTDTRQIIVLITIIVLTLATFALINNLAISVPNQSTASSSDQTATTVSTTQNKYFIPDSIGQVVKEGYSNAVAVNPNMQLTVLVGLKFSNPNLLSNYLSAVQNPSSNHYHQYLSREQFTQLFSPSISTYSTLQNFFVHSGLKTSTFADRVTLKLTGSVAQFEKVFHTQIMNMTMNGKRFYAPIQSLSLNTNVSNITAIIGLNNYYKFHTDLSQAIPAQQQVINASFTGNSCQSGDTYCSNQALYGSDLQNAYQLNQLFSKGYPIGETIATILWAGQTYSGTVVAPFVPSDINNYLTNYMPSLSTEPHSNATSTCPTYSSSQGYICGYPIDGAPIPGPSAVTDYTQVNFESTLDLEMAGSVAPGANVVEVYGPGPYSNYLDDAFATILNAPSSGLLSHTVAISNSWGTTEDPNIWSAVIDPLMQQYTQEAAALGITVLASSGDNANYNGQTANFPSTMAYNNFGMISVGGTQTTLSGSYSNDGSGTTGISNQTVWFNEPSTYSGSGIPGSQGGVSLAYSEPIWQKQSFDANQVITSQEPQVQGRGTPDIAAVASNMLITISYNTYSSSGSLTGSHTNSLQTMYGTSVASPLVAGVVADMNHYLGASEGYFENLIYQLGQAQYDGQFSSLKPFSDVIYGYNVIFQAQPGYDLVTGWGSINAYNFTVDQTSIKSVTFNEIGLPASTPWSVTLDNGAILTSTTSAISFNVFKTGSHTFSVSDGAGHIANVTQGSFTMLGSSIKIPIAFASSLESGSGVNTTVATNLLSNTVGITFSIAGSTVAHSDLPMAENFNISADQLMNTISLYLNGTGQVAVSIGSNLWQSDILAPITLSVTGLGWYNATFPTINLLKSVGSYYLNVWIANNTFNSVSWGYISDATTYTPTTSIGDVGSFSNLTLQYPNNYYTLDTNHPAIYAITFHSAPPVVLGPSNTSLDIINPDTLSWQISSAYGAFGSQNYAIYKNGTEISSGSWTNANNITIANKESDIGLFNYTIVIYDAVGGYAIDTVWVQVNGTSNSTYTSTVTNVVTSSTTSLVTTTAVNTTTEIVVFNNNKTVTSTTLQTFTNTNNETATNNTVSTVTQSVTKTKSTPSFELIGAFTGLFFAVAFITRRRRSNK